MLPRGVPDSLRVGLPWRKRHRLGCRGQVLELSHHVAQVFVDGIETAELGSGMFGLNRQVSVSISTLARLPAAGARITRVEAGATACSSWRTR